MSRFGHRRRSLNDLREIKWRDHTPTFSWVALVLLVLALLFSLLWETRNPERRTGAMNGSAAVSDAAPRA